MHSCTFDPLNNNNHYLIHLYKIKSDPRLRSSYNELMLNQHYISSRKKIYNESVPQPSSESSTQNQVKSNLSPESNFYNNNSKQSHHHHHYYYCRHNHHQQYEQNYHDNEIDFENEITQSSFVHPINCSSNNSSDSNLRVSFPEFRLSPFELPSNNNTNKPHEYTLSTSSILSEILPNDQKLRTYASCSSFKMDKPHEYSYKNDSSYHGYHHHHHHRQRKNKNHQKLRTYASYSSLEMDKPREYSYQNNSSYHDYRENHQYIKNKNHQQSCNNDTKSYRINYVDHKIIMLQEKK